jgi:hypothetical protein
MRSRIQLQTLRDWTGGLNLRRDTVQLAPSESPDMLNVDVDGRGGFHQRWGVTPYSDTALSGAAKSAWVYANSTGTRQVMVADGSTVKYSTGGTFTTAFNRTGTVRAAVLKDRCYATQGTTNSVRWDGTSVAVLNWAQAAANWNNTLETPTSEGVTGAMPVGRLVAAHVSHLWVANTLEGGVRRPNRLRFSHPNFPESWRSTDFIDVDPGLDGDEITALVPQSDHLLVFKRNSIHAVYGTDPETFQVLPISRSVGTISQESVVATDLGVFFFSWPDGVFRLTPGKAPEYVFDRISPAIRDSKIPQAYASQIHLGWGNRRLWVSVPWQGSTTPRRVFVLDPTLTKQGSWMAYDLPLTAFVELDSPDSVSLLLACHGDTHKMLMLDQRVAWDDYGEGDVAIPTRFRTSWLDFGDQAVRKRWKRPEFMLRGGTSADVYVKVFHDWDPTAVKRTFYVSTAEDSASSATVTIDPDTGETVGEGWGAATWGVSTWGRSGTPGGPVPGSSGANITDRAELRRGTSLGQSKSVAFEFVGPSTLSSWGVDAVTVKLVPRRVRS